MKKHLIYFDVEKSWTVTFAVKGTDRYGSHR